MAQKSFPSKLDWFAELVADGKAPKEAAAEMGLRDPVYDGNTYMQRLRRKMGPQAV